MLFLCLSVAAGCEVEAQTTGSSAFDWLGNANYAGSQAEARSEARLALQRASRLGAGATWVCSPAGFGKPSRCYRG